MNKQLALQAAGTGSILGIRYDLPNHLGVTPERVSPQPNRVWPQTKNKLNKNLLLLLFYFVLTTSCAADREFTSGSVLGSHSELSGCAYRAPCEGNRIKPCIRLGPSSLYYFSDPKLEKERTNKLS